MLAKTSIKWGVLLGIGLALGSQILTWLGLGVSNWFVVLTYLLVIVFVALGLGNLKRLDDGKLTLGKAALSVVIIILISRVIFQLYMFVYINYIDPNWVNDVAETWTTMMQEAEISDEQIDQRIKSFRQAWKPLPMFTFEVVVYAIPQIVLGLITSLFFVFKKARTQAPLES